MLNIGRYVGQSVILTTSDGDIVVKVDRLANFVNGGRAEVFLSISAPKEVRITREPR